MMRLEIDSSDFIADPSTFGLKTIRQPEFNPSQAELEYPNPKPFAVGPDRLSALPRGLGHVGRHRFDFHPPFIPAKINAPHSEPHPL